jgi:arylsulfatase A-like enzyme
MLWRLSFLVSATMLLPALGLAQPVRAARPNVVLVLLDDVGYGDIGSYGAPDVKTPNIDRVAREGVRLTDFYANGATCSPTRTGLISGRYQQRVGLEAPLGAGGKADATRGLLPTGTSLPQLLKGHGYVTGLVGKWHLGWLPQYSPGAHGFDQFFGFKSGYIDYYQHVTGGNSPLIDDLFENDQPVKVDGYITDLITERAVRFVEAHASRPFFLDVSYSAAHWPYQPPDQPSTARDGGRHLTPLDEPTSTRADYVRMLERADEGVGRILEALDRLRLRNDTLVIVTSDNGGEWLSRNAPFFHHKGSLWEGGIRVPAVVRWPARIPAGQTSSQVGATMDLAATILAATGASVPTAARHDGMNLLPVFEGRSAEVERTLFWRVTLQRTQVAVRAGEWKLLIDNGRPLLYNLARDAGERENVIASHTDVARRLRVRLAAWEAEVDAEYESARR